MEGYREGGVVGAGVGVGGRDRRRGGVVVWESWIWVEPQRASDIADETIDKSAADARRESTCSGILRQRRVVRMSPIKLVAARNSRPIAGQSWCCPA